MELAVDGGDVGDELASEGRQRHALDTARKYLAAELCLDALDRPGKGRLRNEEIARGLINATGFCNLYHVVNLIVRHLQNLL